MNSAAKNPRPSRYQSGPAWLSRSLFVSVAVWLVLLGASIGAAFAVSGAWHEIKVQRYLELHFMRSTFLILERAADNGALQGALTALWFLIGGLLASAYAPLRALFDPRELSSMLASRDRLLRAQLTIAIAFLVAILALAYYGESLTRVQVVLLGALAMIGIAALSGIARALRKFGRPNDPGLEASAFAACAATLVIVSLGFVVNGERIWRPFEKATLAANLILLAGALGTFFLLRRALNESHRTNAPAGRSALGGIGVRAFLALLVLPALSPLFVRALAIVYGHSGLSPETSLNVVVIGIDTLRADCVNLTPPAEGERDRTPNLRELARHGVRFTQAISQSPWTMPAFASIFTGKYPLEHGAVSLSGNLRDREVTLAEILREAGYKTGSFVSNDYTDQKHGFRQGNDEFKEDCVKSATEVTSKGITDQAADFVERHTGQPFFLFAHYMDPHYQYVDHQGWTWADDYRGWWKDQNDLDNLVRNRNLVNATDLKWLRDLYDEEIAYTDSEIGRLLATLKRSGVMDRTLIVVVADHGEEFMDHGNFSHTTTLYEELVHVPMFIVVPNAKDAGSERTDVVETRSVFSTVLDCLGIDFGSRSRPKGLLPAPSKQSKTPAVGELAVAGAEHAFSMVWLPDAKPKWGKQFEIASLRTPRWKLIDNITRKVYELFDIAADPGEKHDLSGSEPEVFKNLRAELDAWIENQELHAGDLPHAESGGDNASRLKSLGYM